MKMNLKNMIVLVSCLASFVASAQTNSFSYKIIKHAHNDYKHKNPLFDALDQGFYSVEADVYLVDDSLYVAHDKHEIQSGRTLRKLYLDPLKKRIQQNNGSVYGNGEEIILFIDIKENGLEVYKKLHSILENYSEIISSSGSDGLVKKAVRVVISGDRPIEYMQNQKFRHTGVDGRLENLDGKISSDLMPIISDSWLTYFEWNGEGEMPAKEKNKLKEFVNKAHEKGYLIRFLDTPNETKEQRLAFWKLFADVGVDLIGTDHLEELNKFIAD